MFERRRNYHNNATWGWLDSLSCISATRARVRFRIPTHPENVQLAAAQCCVSNLYKDICGLLNLRDWPLLHFYMIFSLEHHGVHSSLCHHARFFFSRVDVAFCSAAKRFTFVVLSSALLVVAGEPTLDFGTCVSLHAYLTPS